MFQQFFFLLILFSSSSSSSAFWWSLNSIPETDLFKQKTFCSSLTFLTIEQRLSCEENPKIFSIIHRSLHQAIAECQYQFRNQRWNCSIFQHGRILLRKTPEIAFVYALTSAAVMHNIAQACSKGVLKEECHCGENPKIKNSTDGFEWGGCSVNMKFARNVSMTFLDRQEAFITRHQVVRMVNLHNNEAGRQAVERNVQLTCKCHGVSGSCALRVCWRTLADFRLIGSELRTKYVRALPVHFNRRLDQLKSRVHAENKINSTDLVYLQPSPSYCEKNPRLGSLGTQGRECNLTRNEPDSCSILCCGRGYETIIETIEEDCDCQFQWCCEVRCKRCIKKVEKHFCK